MFDRILVPLDRSSLAECVLPHAVALAHSLDAQLLLLHVLTLPDAHDRLRAVDALEWQLRRAEAEKYLKGVCARMAEAGVTCTAQVQDGDAAEQILECVSDEEIGLVLIASHGQSGLSAWHISSVVQKVLNRARASLMIIRAEEPDQPDIASLHYRSVLVPLDGSARAECVLPLAAALTRVSETQILLAHLVKRPEMPRRTPLSREDSELADRLVERNSSEAEAYLKGIRSQLPSNTTETKLKITNQVADSLHDLVEQAHIDLVLLCAHGYSGQMHWPYGSVVASFIAYGSSPLLIFQDAPLEQNAASMWHQKKR